MRRDSDEELLGKIKIGTILDLALTLPISYEDRRLSEHIVPGEICTVEATVISTGSFGERFTAELYLPAFSTNIDAIFFKATRYHRKKFSKGFSYILRGRIKLFRNRLQIVQPKVVNSVGDIIPRYKSAIADSKMAELIKKYIDEKSLIEAGLLPEEARTILKLHFPQRYVGGIPQIGERDKRVLKFAEAFNHITKLRSKKRSFEAVEALCGDPSFFFEKLPFTLTDDQKRAIEDIRKDLSREDRATRRVVIGDVGSGKTMVILAAAAIAGEKGSILMAPTSILAKQLYEEAVKYLSHRLKIALLIQSTQKGDYKTADLTIGTHAILYREEMPKRALVMVDEQHRFGTQQRAALESMVKSGKRHPHYLQFSATPIPRTQAMLESELVDLTTIETTPFSKKTTSIVAGKRDFSHILGRIESEMEKGHQTLIVYPLVDESSEIPYQSIEEGRAFWENRYDGVFVTHGRDRNKEEVLENFRDGGKILLATTVIEVGISLPLLTTIVIVGAERLGLATLHQLRGRVGRNGLESVCFLYTNHPDNERLKRFCNTTDGFEIARLDLLYRNSGDIVDGTIQSGQKFRWLDLSSDENIVSIAKKRAKQGDYVNRKIGKQRSEREE